MGSEVDIISDKKDLADNSEVEQLYADISLAKKYMVGKTEYSELKDLEGELKTLLIGFQQGKI